ncbi:CBS domain-containing protein [Streptomyces sp. NRRL F-2664]|uniref:CBS domain-containing protein n=1 Tax=Streptomyces sp. NRRL F-2664 TaxID=1463842 RepID=UPI000ABB1BCD
MITIQPRSVNADPVHRTVGDAMEAAGPQLGDDMTIEVALAVMAGARAGHLLVRDEDGLCTGLITQGRLAAVRDSAAYTDRVRLRDVLGERGPVTSPVTTIAEAEHAMRYRRLAAVPVVDEQGSALGVLALTR